MRARRSIKIKDNLHHREDPTTCERYTSSIHKVNQSTPRISILLFTNIAVNKYHPYLPPTHPLRQNSNHHPPTPSTSPSRAPSHPHPPPPSLNFDVHPIILSAACIRDIHEPRQLVTLASANFAERTRGADLILQVALEDFKPD